MVTIKFEPILALQILPVHFNISIVLFAFDIFHKLSSFFFLISPKLIDFWETFVPNILLPIRSFKQNCFRFVL